MNIFPYFFQGLKLIPSLKQTAKAPGTIDATGRMKLSHFLGGNFDLFFRGKSLAVWFQAPLKL